MLLEQLRLRLAPAAALLLGLSVIALPAASGAYADDSPQPADTPGSSVSWGVKPVDHEVHGESRANYAYEVQAGSVIEDALVVSNYGFEEITLRVYAADAFTTADGALDLLLPGETSIDLGAWTVSSLSEVTVHAGESAEVPFTITVPDNATPGDHAGGIVTSLAAAQEDGVAVDRRLGSRIHLRVAGELAPALVIESFSVQHTPELNPFGAGTAQAHFTIANTGNVRLYGDQLVRAAGPFGVAGQVHDTELRELLPGESRDVTIDLDPMLPLFWFTGEVELLAHEAGGDHSHAHDPEVVVSATAVGAAIPWSALALLVLLAALVLLLLWLRRRGKAATDRKVEAAVAAALGESASGDETTEAAPRPARDPVR